MQVKAFRLDADFGKNLLYKGIDSNSVVITYLVMTFAKLSAAGKDAVRTFGKSPQDK